MNDVAEIYDNLFQFEGNKKRTYYPVHKSFKPGRKNLLAIILDQIEIFDGERILDAGCGTGNTLFNIAGQYDIIGKGVSLSNQEVKFANSQVEKHQSRSTLTFERKSYDVSFDEKFDKIFAIESLKHARDLKTSLINLNEALESGGTLIIADDFVKTVFRTPLIESQINLWSAESFVSIDTLCTILEEVGNYDIRLLDLTESVALKPVVVLKIMNLLLGALTPVAGGSLGAKLRIYHGALILERLYHKRLISYHLVIAKKK